MRFTAAVLVAMVGVASADTPEQTKIKALETKVSALEARIKQLEAEGAKNAEALDFLRKVYMQQKAQQEAQDASDPASDAVFAVNIADNIKAGMMAGDVNAPVTIVWAFDLADRYSHRMISVMDELLSSYAGKVRVVFKNYIVYSGKVDDAHKAACAAAKQKKWGPFWSAYWKKGYEPYSVDRDATKIDAKAVAEIARGAGLDMKKFEVDRTSKACGDFVKADIAELTKFHVAATPTFFVNGVVVNGAMPKEHMAQVIDERLAAVKASKVPAAKYYEKEVMAKGEKKFRSKKDAKP
jgi:protein-disulfide isomerase